MQIFRLLAAFILAPFVGPVIAVIVVGSVMAVSDSLVSLYVFTYTSIAILRYFGWALTIALSIPVYLLLRRMGWLGWWQFMLAWGAAQALPAVVLAALFPGSSVFVVTSFVEGTVGGAAFRLIAGRVSVWLK